MFSLAKYGDNIIRHLKHQLKVYYLINMMQVMFVNPSEISRLREMSIYAVCIACTEEFAMYSMNSKSRQLNLNCSYWKRRTENEKAKGMSLGTLCTARRVPQSLNQLPW